jgi:hypothetical protein
VDVETAYADVVSALLDATPRDVVARFDAEVAAAVAAGTVDPDVARTLRWWQRESVRAVRDHAAVVLPPLITSLVTAASISRADSEAVREPHLGPHREPQPHPDGPAEPSLTQSAPKAVPDLPREETTTFAHPGEDLKRRMLVAGLVALPDSASA